MESISKAPIRLHAPISLKYTRQNSAKAAKVYKVIRKVPIFDHSLEFDHETSPKRNIFGQLSQNQMYDDQHSKKLLPPEFERVLKKFHKNKKKLHSKQILDSKENINLKKTDNASTPNPYTQVKNKNTVNFTFDHHQKTQSQSEEEGQIYKKHSTYSSKKLIDIKSKKQIKEQNLIRSNKKVIKAKSKHDKWVKTQSLFYQGKTSYLNEHTFTKPLIERCGPRYFEMILRNRYQDDMIPPSYIHQIQSPHQESLLVTNKFIEKLRKINPKLNSRKKLVVKGRSLYIPHFDQSLC